MSRETRSGAFPPSLPDSLSSHRSICENDWEAFRNVDQMVNHWGRNEWPKGRRSFFWYLTFQDSELIKNVERCHAHIDSDGIDFVPLDGLHITVLRIGNHEQVPDEDVQAIADIAKEKLRVFEKFSLDIGPLAGSRGALRFSVSPWTKLFQLHEIVRESTCKVLTNVPIAETDQFRPHLGIGYSNRRQDASQFIDHATQLRNFDPVTVEVDNVKIVRLRREEHAYRWEDVATIGLCD
ncbi:2'-5' RNA ligase family protein [Nocardia sp. CC201C]|uniref:2'-5' RNA ligase family protein n=1 Tax=Nocardia sp. CC201C TaxID=3044575 RepID=UPI0024A9C1B9|nr:2'-5' RNA ligase family protein [Nocardia sp. CC201C]